MGRVSRITVPSDVQADMVRMYVHGGLTYKQIGERTHWSSTQVRRVLLANGVTPRAREVVCGRVQMSADEKLARAELYGRGYSLAEVADIRGCSVTSVVLTLERLGVKRRSVGDALRVAYARGTRQPSGIAVRKTS